MPVIKRYPNRKLYDTEAKQYITLEGMAALIRQGEDITVIDHASGDDLTALTLSQIIFEQQKKHSGFLPYSVLAGLIQAGGDTLTNLRRHLSSSLGLSRYVDEEIERRLHLLVTEGQLSEEDASRLRAELIAPPDRHSEADRLDEAYLERFLEEHGVPTRSEMQIVVEQLDALAEKLEGLRQNVDRS
jgi:polyhydroxyalkanoate synthesis repressor PhaR